MSYERIRVEGKTIYLRDPREIDFLGEPALTGTEVDREGEEVAPRGIDERRRIISLALITQRTPVVMSKRYGMLHAENEEI